MPGVPEERIDNIMEDSQFLAIKQGKKTCIVTMILPSGFEMTETAACLDPDDYSDEIGMEIARRKLKDRLWDHEAYLQSEAYLGSTEEESC